MQIGFRYEQKRKNSNLVIERLSEYERLIALALVAIAAYLFYIDWKIEEKIETIAKLMADESTGILEDAIKEVTFKDAVGIVVGGKSEATNILRYTMYGSVKKRYSAKIEEELEKRM